MRRGWWQKFMPALAAMLVIALVLGGVMLIDASEGRRYAEQNVATVTEHAAATRARVEQALNARLFLVRSLIALVRSNPELTQAEFEDAAGAAAEGVPGVRGLALARNAVATHFFPLAGNEQAIGHDLLADPNRRGAILEVIGKRRFLIQGPLPLLQGGDAIIGRLPVILPDGNSPQDGGSGTGPAPARSGGSPSSSWMSRPSSGRPALPTAPTRWSNSPCAGATGLAPRGRCSWDGRNCSPQIRC